MNRENVLEYSLLESVLKGCQPEELAELSAKLLGNPVALLNAAHVVVAASENYPRDDLQDRIARNETLRQKGQGAKYYPANFWAALRKGAPFFAPLLYLRRGHLLCGSVVGGKIAGIVMLPDVGVPFKELDELLISAVARAWSVLLLLCHGLKGTGSFADQEMLWSLLAQPERGQRLLQEKSPAYEPFGAGRRFRMLYGDREMEFEHCSIPDPDGVGIAAILREDEGFDLEALKDAAQKAGARIGVSGVYGDLTETASRYQQAKKALYYCDLMQSDRTVALMDDFRFLSMLDAVPDKKACVDPRLEKIRRYDQDNQTDYMETLRQYLLSNQDAAIAAEKLHIHKNTLLYRINRLKEVFGVDLHDCMQLSFLYCSLVIQDLEEGKRRGERP